jgi:hypothetical protein
MKKCTCFALMLMATAMLNSCGGSADKPEVVAEKFLNHLGKKEFAEAKKLATKESAAAIDMMESLTKTDASDTKAKMIEKVSCKEDGDKASCSYNEDGDSKTLDLVKKDGKWLVEMKKESNASKTDSKGDAEEGNKSGDNSSDDNDKKVKEDASGNSDCEQFLKDYETFATSYISILKKYKSNPSDMTIMGEYTEMAQKKAEMDKNARDCNDIKYAAKITAIASRIASAAAGL